MSKPVAGIIPFIISNSFLSKKCLLSPPIDLCRLSRGSGKEGGRYNVQGQTAVSQFDLWKLFSTGFFISSLWQWTSTLPRYLGHWQVSHPIPVPSNPSCHSGSWSLGSRHCCYATVPGLGIQLLYKYQRFVEWIVVYSMIAFGSFQVRFDQVWRFFKLFWFLWIVSIGSSISILSGFVKVLQKIVLRLEKKKVQCCVWSTNFEIFCIKK